MQLRLNKKRGFSIIEFAIMASVIVTLSSIGSISWNRSLKKGRTVEAKSNLSLMAQAQISYRAICSEYQPILELLVTSGFSDIIPKGEIYYNVGGQSNQATGTNFTMCGAGGTTALSQTNTGTRSFCGTEAQFKNLGLGSVPCYLKNTTSTTPNLYTHIDNIKGNSALVNKMYPGGIPTVTHADGTTGPVRGDGFQITDVDFMLFAVGDISKRATPIYDVWVIDEKNILTHVQNGLD